MNTEPFLGIDPLPFIRVAPQRLGRRRLGKNPRVLLSGATVDRATLRQLKRWQGASLSLGIVFDQLCAFARRRKFKPVRTTRKPSAR